MFIKKKIIGDRGLCKIASLRFLIKLMVKHELIFRNLRKRGNKEANFKFLISEIFLVKVSHVNSLKIDFKIWLIQRKSKQSKIVRQTMFIFL